MKKYAIDSISSPWNQYFLHVHSLCVLKTSSPGFIISGKRWRVKRQNRRFAELTEDKRKLILKVQNHLDHLKILISLTKFERVFSDSSFSRSSRHKVQILCQPETHKVWRPNAYAADYINAVLCTVLKIVKFDFCNRTLHRQKYRINF